MQRLYSEAVVWKRTSHPNIVPFHGATLDPPQLISEWMYDLMEFIKERPKTNRLGLVRVPPPYEWGCRVLTRSLAVRRR